MPRTDIPTFQIGEPVVFVNANNLAFQGVVKGEFTDEMGADRVTVEYWGEDGESHIASPHVKRVGRKSINFH